MSNIVAHRMVKKFKQNANFVPDEFIVDLYPANKLFERLYRGHNDFQQKVLEMAEKLKRDYPEEYNRQRIEWIDDRK